MCGLLGGDRPLFFLSGAKFIAHHSLSSSVFSPSPSLVCLEGTEVEEHRGCNGGGKQCTHTHMDDKEILYCISGRERRKCGV